MIKLSTDNKPFGFTVDQDKFSSILSTIKNLAGNEGSFYIICEQKELWVAASSSMFIGALKVEATEVIDQGQFGFNADLIQGVTKGRAAIKFNFTGSECEFKAIKTKYAGKIVTIPITKEQASCVNDGLNEKSKSIKLSPDVLIAISNGITSTSLVNLVDKQKCNSYIDIEENKIVVSSFDEYHMMLYSNKVKCDEKVKFSINPQTMGIIQKAINGKFELSVKKESIRFSGKDFIIIVPTVQADDAKYAVASSYIRSLGKNPIFSASVDTKALMDTCMNLDTIHTANSQFDLELESKGFAVRFVTEQGSAEDTIGAEEKQGQGMCSLNPKGFMDMLGCVKMHGATSVEVAAHESVCYVKANKKGSRLEGVCVLTANSSSNKEKSKSDKKKDKK